MKELIFSFVGSFSAGIIFNVAAKKLIWIGFSGAIGWIVYSLLYSSAGSLIFSTFAGAIAVGIYSESMARLVKSPSTIFSIPGIFPLVPGITAYTTVQYMVENNLSGAASKAVETAASAGAIAFGIMIIYGLFRLVHKINSRRKKSINYPK
ncbi:MAG: threonine/serine exporter family protein [Bacillota bacterium]|nr:threonine/serine exporter family protein [Bacillota bacterium]